jgi:hypothetical protein
MRYLVITTPSPRKERQRAAYRVVVGRAVFLESLLQIGQDSLTVIKPEVR